MMLQFASCAIEEHYWHVTCFWLTADQTYSMCDSRWIIGHMLFPSCLRDRVRCERCIVTMAAVTIKKRRRDAVLGLWRESALTAAVAPRVLWWFGGGGGAHGVIFSPRNNPKNTGCTAAEGWEDAGTSVCKEVRAEGAAELPLSCFLSALCVTSVRIPLCVHFFFDRNFPHF